MNITVSNAPEIAFLRGRSKQLLIGGAWVDADSGVTFETVDPATERSIISVAAGGEQDIDQAVNAARDALLAPSWSKMDPYERTHVLLRIADIVDRHAEELAAIETVNVGMPITVAKLMVTRASEVFRYFAGWATKIYGETNPSLGDIINFTLREPVGVCGAIIPWNGPIAAMAWKIAPALACGNTVVLKPAEQTPLTAIRFGELLLECDLPPGVVNIVTGFGETAGAALVRHPGVDKLSFTGSNTVGMLIARSTGGLKRLTLELGGKSPNIIFADADVAKAIDSAVASFCLLSGQRCIAGTKIFAHRDIYQEVVAGISEAAEQYAVGDPWDSRTLMGPLASKAHFERVIAYFDIARLDGARVATGGPSARGKGYFVRPTVYADVDNRMRVAREEIFGPVVCILPFDDEDDALRQANDTEFGLAAAVWTKDFGRAQRVARGLKAGTVGINCYPASDPIAPFGGYKQSGIGRELGSHAIYAYTEVKSVFADVS